MTQNVQRRAPVTRDFFFHLAFFRINVFRFFSFCTFCSFFFHLFHLRLIFVFTLLRFITSSRFLLASFECLLGGMDQPVPK